MTRPRSSLVAFVVVVLAFALIGAALALFVLDLLDLEVRDGGWVLVLAFAVGAPSVFAAGFRP